MPERSISIVRGTNVLTSISINPSDEVELTNDDAGNAVVTLTAEAWAVTETADGLDVVTERVKVERVKVEDKPKAKAKASK